jgi:RimJ/RimL family protein N-acetyltransferase
VVALTRFGFEFGGLQRLEIGVDPLNLRSLAVPRRLGYTQEATLRGRLEGGADRVVFSMFARDYAASPCAGAPLQAYGAAGQLLTPPV